MLQSPRKCDALFQPLNVGPITRANRIMLSATHLGAYTSRPRDYLGNLVGFVGGRAQGGAAAIILTALGSSNIDALPPDEVDADWYRAQADLSRPIAEAADEHGALLGTQLQPRGAQGGPAGQPRWVPPPFKLQGTLAHWGNDQAPPQELTRKQSDVLLERYELSARPLAEAGFDLGEVQASHGCLLTEFLLPRSNQREDEWGGREGGARLMGVVVERVRAGVGGRWR